jgi:hypothetical protein
MYKPTYFQLFELVPREIFELYHGSDILWYLFDDRILLAGDLIRRRYGPCYINTWYWCGYDNYRGFRPADCPIGALLSQHKFGRAEDITPRDVTAEEIRIDIMAGKVASGLITCIEAEVPHLHIDCRVPDSGGQIKIVYPVKQGGQQ